MSNQSNQNNDNIKVKPSQLLRILTHCIEHKEPVLIKGAPGTGKSDIVAQACQASGARLIISHPVVSDPTDYKGLPFPAKHIRLDGTEVDAAKFLPFGELHELIEADSPTVFLLDDLGQAPMSVQAACMQLILARKINGHQVSKHVVFVACTNNRRDKAGVMGILEPVKSRFAAIVEIGVETEDWVNWAINAGMPHQLVSFIRFRPSLLHDFHPTADIENSPSPRTVAAVGRLMNSHLPDDLKYPMYAGAAGPGFAAELNAYLNVYSRLPSVSAILSSPDTAEVYTDPSMNFAVSGMLANASSTKNIDDIIKYAKRMPAEFQVLMIRDCVRHSPATGKTQSFIAWSVANRQMNL